MMACATEGQINDLRLSASPSRLVLARRQHNPIAVDVTPAEQRRFAPAASSEGYEPNCIGSRFRDAALGLQPLDGPEHCRVIVGALKDSVTLPNRSQLDMAAGVLCSLRQELGTDGPV